MEVNKIKQEIIKYFKLAGYQIRSENALILVEKIKELSGEEKREYLAKILSNIQNQNIEINSIEKDNILAAIKVN
jgi:hypothetical protein